VPEAYKFITIDFTADPSTYGAYPIDIQRGVSDIVKRGVGEGKMSKAAGRAILEALQVPEARVVRERIDKCDGKCPSGCNMVLNGVCVCKETSAAGTAVRRICVIEELVAKEKDPAKLKLLEDEREGLDNDISKHVDSLPKIGRQDREGALPTDLSYQMHYVDSVTKSVFWYNVFTHELDISKEIADHGNFDKYEYYRHSRTGWVRGRVGELDGKQFVMIYDDDFPRAGVPSEWVEEMLGVLNSKTGGALNLVVDQHGRKVYGLGETKIKEDYAVLDQEKKIIDQAAKVLLPKELYDRHEWNGDELILYKGDQEIERYSREHLKNAGVLESVRKLRLSEASVEQLRKEIAGLSTDALKKEYISYQVQREHGSIGAYDVSRADLISQELDKRGIDLDQLDDEAAQDTNESTYGIYDHKKGMTGDYLYKDDNTIIAFGNPAAARKYIVDVLFKDNGPEKHRYEISKLMESKLEKVINTEFSMPAQELAMDTGIKDVEFFDWFNGKEESSKVRTAVKSVMDGVLKSAPEVKIKAFKFNEADSGNVSHAGLYWTVTLYGPEDQLKKVAGEDKAFVYEWGANEAKSLGGALQKTVDKHTKKRADSFKKYAAKSAATNAAKGALGEDAVSDEQAKVKAVVQGIKAIADAIRDLGKVPSGELYAQLMNHMTLDQYNQVIDILKGAGVIDVKNHEITWTGPAKKNEAIDDTTPLQVGDKVIFVQEIPNPETDDDSIPAGTQGECVEPLKDGLVEIKYRIGNDSQYYIVQVEPGDVRKVSEGNESKLRETVTDDELRRFKEEDANESKVNEEDTVKPSLSAGAKVKTPKGVGIVVSVGRFDSYVKVDGKQYEFKNEELIEESKVNEDTCRTCHKEISDEENFSGWCKSCFAEEQKKYRQFLARQEGLDGLSDDELSLLPERVVRAVTGTQKSVFEGLHNWIAATLSNDENSTDEELVAYFIKEGPMSKEQAQKYVAQRSAFLHREKDSAADLEEALFGSVEWQDEQIAKIKAKLQKGEPLDGADQAFIQTQKEFNRRLEIEELERMWKASGSKNEDKQMTAEIIPYNYFGFEAPEGLVYVVKDQMHPDPAKKMIWGRSAGDPEAVVSDFKGHFEKAGAPVTITYNAKGMTASDEQKAKVEAIKAWIKNKGANEAWQDHADPSGFMRAAHDPQNTQLIWWYNPSTGGFMKTTEKDAKHSDDLNNGALKFEEWKDWMRGRVFEYDGKAYLIVYWPKNRNLTQAQWADLYDKAQNSVPGKVITRVIDDNGDDMSGMFESTNIKVEKSPAGRFFIKEAYFPPAVDPKKVGSYPSLTKAGGGYVYDDVLEYRVCPHDHSGEGDDAAQTYPTYAEARKIYDEAVAAGKQADLVVLVRQDEYIDEPEKGVYIRKKGQRITEWLPEWLDGSKRTEELMQSILKDRKGNEAFKGGTAGIVTEEHDKIWAVAYDKAISEGKSALEADIAGVKALYGRFKGIEAEIPLPEARKGHSKLYRRKKKTGKKAIREGSDGSVRDLRARAWFETPADISPAELEDILTEQFQKIKEVKLQGQVVVDVEHPHKASESNARDIDETQQAFHIELEDMLKKFREVEIIGEKTQVKEAASAIIKAVNEARKELALVKAERDSLAESRVDVKAIREAAIKTTMEASKKLFITKMDEMKKTHEKTIADLREAHTAAIFQVTVVDKKIAESGIKLPEDSVALLRKARTSEEVDRLLGECRMALRESLLHSGKPTQAAVSTETTAVGGDEGISQTKKLLNMLR
jgi:putative acetyltransferase